MRPSHIRLGPLALLLTVISILLTTLATLTFATARADYALARRFSETVQIRYSLEEQGQQYLSEMNRRYEQGQAIEGDVTAGSTVYKIMEEDGYRLTIGLETNGNGLNIETWSIEKIWNPDAGEDHLWGGE